MMLVRKIKVLKKIACEN